MNGERDNVPLFPVFPLFPCSPHICSLKRKSNLNKILYVIIGGLPIRMALIRFLGSLKVYGLEDHKLHFKELFYAF